MLRSMFAAVSGLRAHQSMMDVVGNNIANVNTTGYKGSRASFQEAMAQTMRGAAGTGDDLAGTNAMQMGLGSQVASVDGVFTQGSTQMTGRTGDLAIQGEGFFMVGQGDETLYTRSGAFNFDESGYLATATGARLQGWSDVNEATGEVNQNGPVGDIQLPMGQVIAPDRTERVEVGGNLAAGATTDATATTSITAYDTEGEPVDVNLTFTKTGEDQWDLTTTVDATPTPVSETNAITFDDGELQVGGAVETDAEGRSVLRIGSAIDGAELVVDVTALTQFGGASTAEARSQDGAAMGFLRGFEFGQDGTVTGRFSNGESQVLGQVAIATFNNPGGLVREGDSLFTGSPNSGEAIIGAPGAGGAGTLAPGALEMSNVDLAQEFTNLIIAQRGFQANSRGITASDELLQELVNLKR